MRAAVYKAVGDVWLACLAQRCDGAFSDVNLVAATYLDEGINFAAMTEAQAALGKAAIKERMIIAWKATRTCVRRRFFTSRAARCTCASRHATHRYIQCHTHTYVAIGTVFARADHLHRPHYRHRHGHCHGHCIAFHHHRLHRICAPYTHLGGVYVGAGQPRRCLTATGKRGVNGCAR